MGEDYYFFYFYADFICSDLEGMGLFVAPAPPKPPPHKGPPMPRRRQVLANAGALSAGAICIPRHGHAGVALVALVAMVVALVAMVAGAI